MPLSPGAFVGVRSPCSLDCVIMSWKKTCSSSLFDVTMFGSDALRPALRTAASIESRRLSLWLRSYTWLRLYTWVCRGQGVVFEALAPIVHVGMQRAGRCEVHNCIGSCSHDAPSSAPHRRVNWVIVSSVFFCVCVCVLIFPIRTSMHAQRESM